MIALIHHHKCLSLMACVQMFAPVKWGLGSGCGWPFVPPGHLLYRETFPCIPLSGAISEEMGPPAIWPSPPSPPQLPPAGQHLVITPLLLCVLTVLTIKPWPWVFRGPNWTQCWWWLWWMDEGWTQGAGCLLSACSSKRIGRGGRRCSDRWG